MPVETRRPAALVRGRRPARDARRLSRDERELIEQTDYALELLQGKWKVHLVFLMARGVHRHCRLLDCLPGASKKMMTDTLRALERDGLVMRRIFAEVPLRVEYSLTPLGWSLTDPLMAMAEWQKQHSDEVDDARYRYRFADRHGNARRNGDEAPVERRTAVGAR
jgi:DNA-binding HxlR family transcriptional regulator